MEHREDLRRQRDLLYPDLQPLDLSQVGLLSLLQTPPLRILLLDELHLSARADQKRLLVRLQVCVGAAKAGTSGGTRRNVKPRPRLSRFACSMQLLFDAFAAPEPIRGSQAGAQQSGRDGTERRDQHTEKHERCAALEWRPGPAAQVVEKGASQIKRAQIDSNAWLNGLYLICKFCFICSCL